MALFETVDDWTCIQMIIEKETKIAAEMRFGNEGLWKWITFRFGRIEGTHGSNDGSEAINGGAAITSNYPLPIFFERELRPLLPFLLCFVFFFGWLLCGSKRAYSD